MKRVLVILMLAVFVAFLFSNAIAIERVPKNDAQTSKEQKQKEEEKPAPATEKRESTPAEKQVTKPEPVPGQERPREGEVRKPQKEQGISRILKDTKKGLKEQGKDKYDYFIDNNGDGIDDRLEQGKAEKKPEERKAPPEEKKTQPEKRERRGR